MKDIFFPVRKAYYQALSGNITLNAKTVPVHDIVQAKVTYPYVAFTQQQQQVLNRNRGCETFEHTMLIEIVTGYTGNQGGKKDADLIADQIYTLLTPSLPVIVGFDIGLCYPESDFDQGRELTETSSINRRLVTFKNIVSYS